MSRRVPIGLLAAQSDRRLVELVGEGNERAFEVLVRRYRRQLLRYCRRMGLSDSRAEDALQHALLQAWMALDRGTEVRALRPWLYRIVHNAAVNLVRSSSDDYSQLVDGAHADSSAASEAGLESGLAAREALSDVAALPSLQRDAILMSAVDGRSHEEVADALGVTHGAVRGLIYRARSTLRDAAAAVIPQPLISWAAGSVGRTAPTASRLAELSTQGGTAGMGGALFRGAAMAVTAVVLVAGVAVVPHNRHGVRRAKAPSRSAEPPTVAATIQPTAVQTVQHVAAVSAPKFAVMTPAARTGTRRTTASAPAATSRPPSARVPATHLAPAPTSSAPARGTGGSAGAPVVLAASAATNAASPPTTTAPPSETTPPPTKVPSGGEKEPVPPPKEELPPPKEEPPPTKGEPGDGEKGDDGGGPTGKEPPTTEKSHDE